MRYLILSDIHGNLEALEAVLAAAAGQYDHVLALGDFVGYGADPNAVVERVRAIPHVTSIRGNHDKVATGLMIAAGFNRLAREAVWWTGATLTRGNRDWVAALPEGPVAVDDLVEICHGAPFDEDEYLLGRTDIERAFNCLGRPLCLFGHTHAPAVFRCDIEIQAMALTRTASFNLTMEGGSRYLVNCGAVGQPRDGDPRAAFGLVDTDRRTITLTRVDYDIRAAQAKILAAGLPEMLAQRLAIGR